MLSISATIIFMFNGLVDYQLGVTLFLGMLLGGYVGAHMAIKKGNKFIKMILAIVVLVSAAKILIG